MTAIPTLIVAPALLAAGITYRYMGGGDERDRRQQRARGEMTSTSDEQSPDRMQHANQFVPTTMLNSGMHRLSGRGGDAPAMQRGNAVVLRPSSGQRDEGLPIAHYSPQGISTKAPRAGIVGPFPHSEQEIEHSSWWFRTSRSLTGDLGPIEHQAERPGRMTDDDSNQFSSTAGSEHMPGSAASGANEAGDRFVSTSSLVAASDAGNQQAHNAEQPQREGWFWGPAENIERAAADAANTVKHGVDNAGTAIKQAVDDTREWLHGANKAADDAAATASHGMERAVDETSAWVRDKSLEADRAASDATRAIDKQANDASSWMRDRQQEVEEAADDARGWWSDQKRGADRIANAAATEVRDWAEHTADDLGTHMADANESVNRAADRSRAWYDEQADSAAQAVADTAQSVQRHASDASQRAREAASASADSAGATDHRSTGRPDSLLEPKDSTVLQSLDRRFDDAREALRVTGQDLRSMAERIPHPHATNEGIVDADDHAADSHGGACFVESGSGIPTLSNASH
ncbi:hypothetical protein H4R19_000094 [Coemansia spiralis]|nr:hypothetical protein H4R19_000094 [Coemansia spiralis]